MSDYKIRVLKHRNFRLYIDRYRFTKISDVFLKPGSGKRVSSNPDGAGKYPKMTFRLNMPEWVVLKETDASSRKKWKIAVDYSEMNEEIIGDRYSFTNISDVLPKTRIWHSG